MSFSIRLPIKTEQRFRVDASAKDVFKLIQELNGESVLLSTHGELIESVIGSLAGDGVDLDGPMEWKKGSVWILEAAQGKVRSGRYLVPGR